MIYNNSAKQLNFITTSSCNMKCEFCYLHKNNAYKEFDKMVESAWEDGSYVVNAYNTLLALHSNPKEITNIDLWGGETLLHADRFLKNLDSIYKHFPNISQWHLSTNFIIDIEKMVEFIKKVDELAKVETKMIFQLSIDGPEGPITEHGHNGKWSMYYENMEKLTFLLNTTKLYRVNVELMINSTLSPSIYRQEIGTYEGMKNYVGAMKQLCDDFKKRCINERLRFSLDAVFPGYALPYEDTTLDGLELAKIVRMWEVVRQNEFPEIDREYPFSHGIGQLNKPGGYHESNPECSEMVGSLTITPDGTICECSGCFIDSFEPYQKELKEQGEEKLLNRALITSQLNFNPAKMTEEEIDAKMWQVHTGFKNNISTYMNYMLGACKELAQAGQIPYSYYLNPDILYKHLTLLSNTNSCTRENVLHTCIPYMTPISCFRRFLNGVMDYVYDTHLNYEKNGAIYNDTHVSRSE